MKEPVSSMTKSGLTRDAVTFGDALTRDVVRLLQRWVVVCVGIATKSPHGEVQLVVGEADHAVLVEDAFD